MNVKELIEELKKMPKDLPIRTVNHDKINEANNWVFKIEHNNTGESGYECCGEVRLVTSE